MVQVGSTCSSMVKCIQGASLMEQDNHGDYSNCFFANILGYPFIVPENHIYLQLYCKLYSKNL